MTLLFAAALALAAAPPPTAAEAAALAAGEVVLRDLPSAEGGVAVEAIADIRAGREAVWAALVDFDARKESNRSVQSIEHYRPSTASEQWIRWTASAFGVAVTYHNHYVLAADHGTMLHELDATQANDLAGSRGLFTLTDVPAGTRLVYDVETRFGRAIPGVVQRWLSSSAVADFMVDIARRAEGR